MNYRSNLGSGPEYYNNLGYSNVSRNFNKSLSPKRTDFGIQITPKIMVMEWENCNL